MKLTTRLNAAELRALILDAIDEIEEDRSSWRMNMYDRYDTWESWDDYQVEMKAIRDERQQDSALPSENTP